MKLLDTLKSWEHTFTAWVAKAYVTVRNEEPSLVAMGDRVYPYVRQAVQIGLSYEAPEVTAVALPIMDEIHAKMDTAAALLYDFGPHPDVVSALQTVQTNLSSLESTAGIKSDAAKSAILKALTSFSAFLAAVTGAAASFKPGIIDPPHTDPVPHPAA
jgi:hypothetical protein